MSRIRLKPTLGLALLCTMAVLAFSGACQKLEPDATGPRLAIDKSPFPDGIPAEYGRLVAAVSHLDGRWISFWFERPDQSIIGVWVQTHNGRLGKVIEIPRK